MDEQSPPLDHTPGVEPAVALIAEPPVGEQPRARRFHALRRTATVLLALFTVAIAALLAVWFFEIDFEDKTRRVIRTYATEHRQTDLRFPDAGYRPMRTIRGGEDGYDFSAAELAELEESLRQQIQEKPGDSEALVAMAEVCLLRLQPLQAIDILERLRLFTPEDPELLGALAYGHYLRARITRETQDLLRSVDLFEQALKANPDDPVLLFNAGTAAQRAKLRKQAQERYERFLSIESDTGWAAEARLRLREIAAELP